MKTRDSLSDALSVDQLHEIDRRCDAFQQRILAGERPRLEEFAAGVDGAVREYLIQQLGLLQQELLESKQPAGETVGKVSGTPGVVSREPNSLASGEVVFDVEGDAPEASAYRSQQGPEASGYRSQAEPEASAFGSRFEILRPHALGGLGEVSVALDRQLNREVALKKIQPEHADHEETRQRFLREAEITGNLEHPGIASVYGLESGEDGRPQYAMQFIRGETLREAIQRFHDDAPQRDAHQQNLELRRLLNRFVDVCNTVQYAHSRNVVHRDLKPQNVMLGEYGETQIVDWGLAKRLEAEDETWGKIPTCQGELQTESQAGSSRHESQAGSSRHESQAGSSRHGAQAGSSRHGVQAGSSRHGASAACDWLDSLADRVAPEPVREQIRRAIREGDINALEQLAAQPDMLQQPAFVLKFVATVLFDRDRVKAAVVLLRRAQSRYPGDFWINSQLAACLGILSTSQHEEALRFHSIALALRPDNAGALLNYGQALLQLDRFDEAAEAFRKAVDVKPDYAEAHANLGAARRALGELDEALRQYRRAMELKPQLVAAYTGLGHVYRDQGKPGEAMQWYRQALERDPDYAGAYTNLGVLVAEQGEMDEAVRLHRRAAELAPNSPEICYNLANALDVQGDWAEAMDCYRRVIDLKPDHANAYSGLGKLLGVQGQLEEAVETCRRAIELDAECADAYVGLGYALAFQGELDEAIRQYRRAIELDPDLAEAYGNLGVALFQQAKFNEAIQMHRRVIELEPKGAKAYTNLGNALAGQGLLEEAVRQHRRAIELDPNLVEAYGNLGNALRSQGSLDEAIRQFHLALELDSDDPRLTMNLGNVLVDQGRLDEAVEQYHQALVLDPRMRDAHYNLARALNRLGDADGAIRHYLQTIELDPNFAEAHCNLGSSWQRQGQFAESLAAFQRGHSIGSQRPGWPYPSGQWIQQAEQLAAMEKKYQAIAAGEATASNAMERLMLANEICRPKQLYAAAVRLTQEAFAEDAALADQSSFRYNAACYAALAGAGKGSDAEPLDETKRAEIRKQAIQWLEAELSRCSKLLAGDDTEARNEAIAQFKHWQTDSDLAGIRGEEELAQLPEDDRQACRALWKQVASLVGPNGTLDPQSN